MNPPPPLRLLSLWLLLLGFVALLAAPAQAASVPLRRPVSAQQPMWLVHIDTWNYADPEKIIALIPADIRPFVVMNISLSISHNEETSQFQVAEYGYEVAKSWLRACAENRMWAMVQPSSGGYSQFSDFDLSVYEEFYRDYPNFIGFNYCEQFWGYDSPTDPLSARWSDRINHFANLLELSHRHGGYLVVSWCGNQWSPNINPIGMLKRVPAFAAASRAYTENYILCEKYTQQSYQSDMESLCLGAWLSGYSGHYGIRYDDTGWTNPAGEHADFTMATYGAPFLEHVMLTGQTVIDAPELIWTQCFREIGAGAATDGYTQRRWETFPQFDNVSVDLFRKVLDGTVRIPSRREVIDRTHFVVVNDVNSGSADTLYSSPETLFEGLYRMDGDGNLRDNKSFFKKTGRYPTIPTVFQLDDADANAFAVKVNRSAYSARWPTVAAKVAEFDARFPQEYTGDIYAGRHENGWVIYNPFKTGQTASGSIPFKYNTAERMELTLSQYTAGVVKEYADRVTYYLSNYDNVLDTGLKTDLIAIHGATTEPTWSFGDRGNNQQQASVVTSAWADGVFTLTVRHNGPLDITIHCSGAATGRLTAYTPSAIAAPARPAAYVGPLQHEAECFDYRNIGGITRGGNTGAIRNYTGQGYLQFGTGSAAAVRDTVTVLAAGPHRLATRYAVTGADVTSVDLYVNGAKVATPTFPQTPSLSDWAVLEQTVSLQTGANTIEYRSTASRAVALHFDNLTVTPLELPAGLVIQENEAGFAGVDGVVASTQAGHTGAGYADSADLAGAGVEWKLRFPSASTGVFTFRYAAATERVADLAVNGVTVIPGFRFPATGSDSTWALLSVHASVDAGACALRLEAVSAEGLPHIDFLAVGGAEESASSNPQADVYVRDGGSASTNFGTATQLVAKYDATTGSGFTRQTFFKFDVSGLADVQSARLKLVPFQVDGTATLAFERIADDAWSETGMTWNNRPTAAGTLVGSLSGFSVGQQIELDLTQAVKNEAAGDGVLSLRVSNDGWNFIGFHSRESATPAFRPVLEYTRPTVVPGAVELVHLRLDDGSGTLATDAGARGNDGQLLGTASPGWVSGAEARVNGALRLADGAHLALPDGLTDGLHDFSVAFWFRPDAATEGARVFDFGDGTGQNSLAFTPRHAGGTVRFALTINGVAQSLEAPLGTHFAVGAWTHAAVTLAGSTATLYLDGVAVATSDTFTHEPAQLGSSTANFIGRSGDGAAPALAGVVDEFFLHDGALSADEVALLASPPAAPAGLAAAVASGRVVLTWTAVPGATTYTVERAAAAEGVFTVLDTLVGTSFTDTDVLDGTRYLYRVTAGNSLTLGSASSPATALPGPVWTHLRFDAGAGTNLADASGRGWNATLSGSATWLSGANARLGSALRLTGGHAALPAGIVSTLDDCTVSFWVRLDSITTWSRVFDFNNGNTTNSMYFVPRTSGGRVRFGLNGQLLEAPAEVQFTAGVWTHVAVTLSGDTATLYLDGAPVVAGTSFTNNPSGLGATPFNYLGRSASAADGNLAGALDEFVIYDRALAAADIAALAAVPLAPGGLVASTSSTDAADLSVALDWSPLPGAVGYAVQRATAPGGPYVTLATTEAASYRDSAVTPGVAYHYRVSIADGVGGGSVSATSTATPLLGYAAWREEAFAGATDPALVGAEADPDRDGISNLLEYAFGTDPLLSTDTAATPTPTLAPDGAGNLVFEFRLAKGLAPLGLAVETSPTLALWSDSGLTPELVADEGTHRRHRVVMPLADEPRLFVRLRVTLP